MYRAFSLKKTCTNWNNENKTTALKEPSAHTEGASACTKGMQLSAEEVVRFDRVSSASSLRSIAKNVGQTGLRIAVATVLLTSIVACGAKNVPNTANEITPETNYDALMKKYVDEQKKNSDPSTPSVWGGTQYKSSLFSDSKGRQVGDIVTIEIDESASASNTVSTTSSRSSSSKAGVNAALGLPLDFGMKNFLGSKKPFSPKLDTTDKESYDGSGDNSREGQVTATIAAIVTSVLPSGNLIVEGHREILVDNEKQIITVSGIVRPKDITATNTISSTKIANAKISYIGKGQLADTTKQGWFHNLFSWAWPF